jgi:hypothetical protein
MESRASGKSCPVQSAQETPWCCCLHGHSVLTIDTVGLGCADWGKVALVSIMRTFACRGWMVRINGAAAGSSRWLGHFIRGDLSYREVLCHFVPVIAPVAVPGHFENLVIACSVAVRAYLQAKTDRLARPHEALKVV